MKSKKAITLVEMMFAIVIVASLMTLTYAPYNYYQNKAKLKVSVKDISQALYEARNMAVNGSYNVSGNRSIGIYFDSSIFNKGKVSFFSYPHDITVPADIIKEENLALNVKLIKTLKLRDGIQIDGIEGGTNLLFLFDSISGDVSYYRWSGISKVVVNTNIDKIDINISYKGSSSIALQSKFIYRTKTNIIDYE